MSGHVATFYYLIFGMNAFEAKSAGRAFTCSLKPSSKLSFLAPVLTIIARLRLRGKRCLLSSCLLILVILVFPFKTGSQRAGDSSVTLYRNSLKNWILGGFKALQLPKTDSSGCFGIARNYNQNILYLQGLSGKALGIN